MDIDQFRNLLTDVSGGPHKVGTLEGRMVVATCCGYMDARTMVHLKETHGFPLSLCALEATKRGLKIDFGGLEQELICIGKKPETIKSELDEVRLFVASAKEAA